MSQEEIIKAVESMTVLELSELVKSLEEKFGVSAASFAAPAAAVANAGAAAVGEEKDSFDVILKEAGANKLAVIKAVRELKPDLGLMDAKALVESAPKDVLVNVKKEDAEAAVKKINDAGGKGEMK